VVLNTRHQESTWSASPYTWVENSSPSREAQRPLFWAYLELLRAGEIPPQAGNRLGQSERAPGGGSAQGLGGGVRRVRERDRGVSRWVEREIRQPLRQILSAAFIPTEVAPSYIPYMRWKVCQRAVSSFLHALATQVRKSHNCLPCDSRALSCFRCLRRPKLEALMLIESRTWNTLG